MEKQEPSKENNYSGTPSNPKNLKKGERSGDYATSSAEVSKESSSNSKELQPTSSPKEDDEEREEEGSDKNHSSDWVQTFSTTSNQFEEKLQSFVRERPLLIMAGAIALGYIANRFFMSASEQVNESGAV